MELWAPIRNLKHLLIRSSSGWEPDVVIISPVIQLSLAKKETKCLFSVGALSFWGNFSLDS